MVDAGSRTLGHEQAVVSIRQQKAAPVRGVWVAAASWSRRDVRLETDVLQAGIKALGEHRTPAVEILDSNGTNMFDCFVSPTHPRVV